MQNKNNEKKAQNTSKSFEDKKSLEKVKKGKFVLLKSDLLFYCLILITFIGTIVFIQKSKNYVESLREKYPKYFFPSMNYITKWSIVFTIALLIPKVFFENLITRYNEKLLDPKYFTPEFSAQKKKVKKKMAIYFIKFIHYLILSIYSYYLLDKYDWFPKELFGHGNLKNLYHKGLTSFSFFERSKGFEVHYLINLAYTYADLICVLFIYDGQTDFLTMIFHHFCTISLILFSYYNQYSSVGAIILFLHNATDIIVYLGRAILYTNINGTIKKLHSVVLLSSFIYVRIFVLAKVTYGLAVYPTWETSGINEGFVTLLTSLYILHCFWTYKLISIAFNALIKGKYSDSREFNKDKKILSNKKNI